MDSHFCVLIFSFQFVRYLWISSNRVCRVFSIDVALLSIAYNIRSSANASAFDLLSLFSPKSFRRLAVKILKRNGESTVPCCRPFVTLKVLVEVSSPADVLKCLLCVIFQRILIRWKGRLALDSLYRRPSSHTVSKAFSRSIRQAPTHWPSFSAQ